METKLFEKLQQLKLVLRQLGLERRLAIVEQIRSQLPPEALTTRDGQHTFSAENLLVLALVVPHCTTKNDLASICGIYKGGYQSELRRCIYHNSAGVPKWSTEINRLYHIFKEHVSVELPALPEYVGAAKEDYKYGEDAWNESKF